MRLYICKDFQWFIFILYALHNIFVFICVCVCVCVCACVCNKACHNLHIRDEFVINTSYMFAMCKNML
jgi:hypothetical protein